jgi:hypothetical protein
LIETKIVNKVQKYIFLKIDNIRGFSSPEPDSPLARLECFHKKMAFPDKEGHFS